MAYKLMKNLIAKGTYTKARLAEMCDVYYAANRLTDEQYADINGNQCLAAVYNREYHGEHAQQMKIREKLQQHLGNIHQCAQHGEQDQFPGSH